MTNARMCAIISTRYRFYSATPKGLFCNIVTQVKVKRLPNSAKDWENEIKCGFDTEGLERKLTSLKRQDATFNEHRGTRHVSGFVRG